MVKIIEGTDRKDGRHIQGDQEPWLEEPWRPEPITVATIQCHPMPTNLMRFYDGVLQQNWAFISSVTGEQVAWEWFVVPERDITSSKALN